MNKHTARSVCPGIISATLLGVKYSSSSLDDQRMIDRFQKPLQRGPQYCSVSFEFIDRHTSMFSTVFILHVIQIGLLVLGSIGCLVLRINIHSLVPVSKSSQLPERIENMCRNEKHALCWSHFGIVFSQLLLR